MSGSIGPTKRTISDVKRLLMQPALTSHYEVYITPPPEPANNFIKQSTFDYNITDILRVSCSEASLPGSSLATHELNNDYTGVTQRHAYRRLYDDRADFTFYVNQKYDQIRYFEAWMRFICGEQISGSDDINNFYRVRYPNQYKAPKISITKFERNSGTKEKSGKMEYKFINAFPISISSMPVSYDTSQLLKVTVSFTYDRYVSGNVAQNSVEGEPGQSTANSVPDNPFDITPQALAEINSNFGYNSNISLNNLNISPGTVFDAGRDDPTRVFQNAELDSISSNFRF